MASSWSRFRSKSREMLAAALFLGVAPAGVAVSFPPKTAAVVGAGPAGLLTSIMLARRGWNVEVIDQLSAPLPPADPSWGVGERSYQLGLNGRGQRALAEYGCMERVDRYAASVRGRLNFAENGKPSFTLFKPPGEAGADKSYVTRVMQRDRLQACLLEEARQYPRITIAHGRTCVGIDLSGEKPVLESAAVGGSGGSAAADSTPRQLEAELIVGADGISSKVRAALEADGSGRTRAVRFAEVNERRYKTIPLHPERVNGTRTDLGWGCRNKTLELGMDALPTKEGTMVGVLLFKPESEASERLEQMEDAKEARAFFGEALPGLLPYLDDAELGRFARRPVGKLPSFQLVEGDLHRALPSGAVVLLGDAIKAVKPYFGQGANSALEDCRILGKCLDESAGEVPAAAAAFSERRAEDARALVRISRSFDFPGRLGTLRFLLPLVVDANLHKLLPSLFSPPLLRAMQDGRWGFAQLQRRKRWERLAQLTLGAVSALALAAAAKVLARMLPVALAGAIRLLAARAQL